jgi:2,3-bisphosphoglycerate-dependent phosphoglycerate mutase
MTTRFIVVRHGETQWNVEHRIQGFGNSPLTARGEAQADAIGERLARERFDALVASDLGRAMQTAQRIAARTGHQVIPDARLRERNFGIGEGMTYAEIDARFPGAFSRTQEMDPDFRVPQGETRREFHERIMHAFEALASEHDGQRICVVAHGGVLAAIYRVIHDIPVAQPHTIPIANAAYNAITFEADRWALEAWDDVDHLPAAVPFVES